MFWAGSTQLSIIDSVKNNKLQVDALRINFFDPRMKILSDERWMTSLVLAHSTVAEQLIGFDERFMVKEKERPTGI